jgi:ABC-type sulfate transport system permease subunit
MYDEEFGMTSSYSPFQSILFWVITIIVIVALWKIFEKAGKPGWASLIPIYNVIVLLEIIGKPLWWIILLLIPLVNIIFGIWAVNLLSKSFGKNEGFTIGLIFLPFIFYPILGFGDAKYEGPAGS